jgi:putative peptidoglycan lipid II flippase
MGTAASRVLGLAREVTLAHFFGATGALDAFWIAFLIPNILRRLLGEGGIAIAFVPTYLRQEREGKGAEFLRAALSFALILFPLICAVGAYLAPKYVPLLAAGFPPPRLSLAAGLSRVLFPFLGLVGLGAMFAGLLNIRGYFFLPAVSPVFFSLGAIIGALLSPYVAGSAYALAGGILGGALLQVILLSFPLRRELRLGLPWHPGLVEVGKRLIPALAGLLLSELNALVDNRLASGLPAGSVSVLQYGMRLFYLPMGIIVASVGMAILPRLSRDAMGADPEALRRGLREGMELVLTWVLPATAGLLLLGRPIIGFLFGHGAFGAAAVEGTYRALAGYLVGLWGYALLHIFTRAFHALGLLGLPPLILGISVGVNVALDLTLVGIWGVFGLSLATGISGCVGGILAGVLLWRRIPGWLPGKELFLRLFGVAVMAGAVYGVDRYGGVHLGEFGRVAVGVVLGIIVYLPFTGRHSIRSVAKGFFSGTG